MTALTLPDFYIHKNTYEKNINDLLKIIKPDWNEDDVQIKALTGGGSSNTYRASSATSPEESITFKSRKEFYETFQTKITNRKFEAKIIQKAYESKVFPKVYAIYQNGYCYQYIRGKPFLNWHDPGEEIEYDNYPVKQVAEKLAEINSIKLKDEDYSQSDFFNRLQSIVDKEFPENSDFADKFELRKEINYLVEYAKTLKFRVVQSHADVQPGNIVWCKEEDKVTIVDWELSHVGYQGFDIANFLDAMFFQEVTPCPGMPKLLTPAEQDIRRRQFIRFYLDKWTELNPTIEVREEELYKNVLFFSLLWYLFLTLLMGVFTEHMRIANEAQKNAEDIKIWIKATFQHYFKIKDEVLKKLKSL